MIVGTLAAISPSYMVGAQAFLMDNRYNSYEPKQYPDNNYYNSYEPDYGMDSDKNPQIFPANEVAQLGDKWWQWAFSINTEIDTNPFTEFGPEGCDVGLQDNWKLLFLVGTGRDEVTGDFPVHECDIKREHQFCFPY